MNTPGREPDTLQRLAVFIIAWAAGVGSLWAVRHRGEFLAVRAYHEFLAELGVPSDVRNLDQHLLLVLGSILAGAIGLAFVGRSRNVFRALGLWAPISRGLVFAAIAVLPMLAVSAATGDGPRFDLRLLRGAVGAPLAEETLFRGLLCLLVVRYARLPFWPLAFASGVLFGAMHLSEWTSAAAQREWPVFLVTGAGGVFYCWVAARWRYNLWPVIFLHAFMNLSWHVFDVAENAAGGLWANVGRAGTVTIAVLLTLHPEWFRLPRGWTTRDLRPEP